MFLYQDIKNTEAYKVGFEFGKWITHNPIIYVMLGVLLFVGLIGGFTKVIKQIRIFGE